MNKQKQKNIDNDAGEIILEVSKPIILEDGVHTGVITNVVFDDSREFPYLDIWIRTQNNENDELDVKTGVPLNLDSGKFTEKSQLGKILIGSGFDMAIGSKLTLGDIKEKLIQRDIQFQTYTEKTDSGEFPRVMNKTINFI